MPPEEFTLLSLPARYDLADADLAAHRDAAIAAHPDLAADITRAFTTLSDPEQRAAILLRAVGGPGPDDPALPPDFVDRLRAGPLNPTPADRQARLNRLAKLFILLGAADNGVVQRERRRQVRAELNALAKLRGGNAY